MSVIVFRYLMWNMTQVLMAVLLGLWKTSVSKQRWVDLESFLARNAVACDILITHLVLVLTSQTVRLAATNEVATYSNGSLASSRIINAKRSEKAIVAVYLKFADETRYDKLRVFRKTVEKVRTPACIPTSNDFVSVDCTHSASETQFVKERPREWISLQSFRPVDVEQDQGYVQCKHEMTALRLYRTGATLLTGFIRLLPIIDKVQLQHRESWQNLNSILNSKSEVTSFSLEASKQLGMRYVAPRLPVDLHMDGNSTKAIARTSTGAS